MASITTKKVRWTIEDLEGLPDNSNRYEIIDGDLIAQTFVNWLNRLYQDYQFNNNQ